MHALIIRLSFCADVVTCVANRIHPSVCWEDVEHFPHSWKVGHYTEQPCRWSYLSATLVLFIYMCLAGVSENTVPPLHIYWQVLSASCDNMGNSNGNAVQK